MTKIKTLKSWNEDHTKRVPIAPRTHVKAVLDNNGNTLDSLMAVQDEKLSELGSEVENINSLIDKIRIVETQSTIIQYKIHKGEKFKIENFGKSIALFSRIEKDGEDIETISGGLASGKSSSFTATSDANYIRIYASSDSVDFTISREGNIVSKIEDIQKKVSNRDIFPTNSALLNNVISELYISEKSSFAYSDVDRIVVQYSNDGFRQVFVFGSGERLAGATLPNKNELFGVYELANGVYIALNEGGYDAQGVRLSSKCTQLNSNPTIHSYLLDNKLVSTNQRIDDVDIELKGLDEKVKKQSEIRGEKEQMTFVGLSYATITDEGELVYDRNSIGAGQRIRYNLVKAGTAITISLKNTAGFKTPIHASLYDNIPSDGESTNKKEDANLVVKYLEINEEYSFEYRCETDGYFVIDGYNLEGTGISLLAFKQSVTYLSEIVFNNSAKINELVEEFESGKLLDTIINYKKSIKLSYLGLSGSNIDESGKVSNTSGSDRCKYTRVSKNTKVTYTIINNASWEHVFRISLYANIPKEGDMPIEGCKVETLKVGAYQTGTIEYDCKHNGYICFFGYGAGDGTRPLSLEGLIYASINEQVLDGGKILWVGTSIPEGSTYPRMSCMKIGALCINNAVGSSSLRFLNEHPSSVTSSSGKNLTATVAEQESLYRQDVASGKITEADLEVIKGYSYERRIIPYIDGTNEDQIDVLVIDHGYNDRSNIHEMMLNKDSIDWESRDRKNFVGAFNYLIDKLFAIKPNLKIVIAGYFQNTVVASGSITYYAPEICEMQTLIAEKYSFSIMKAWEHTQINGKFVAGTSKYFEEFNNKYGTNYTAKKTDENGNITSIQMYCPDEVHPHSDLSGITNQRLNAVYAKLLRGCVDF